jgi:hypothetical protein
MDSVKVWRSARRLWRAEARMAQLEASADAARSALRIALGQSEDGHLVAGGYKVSVARDGSVEVTLLPMLRGDQLDLPLYG